MFTIESRLHLNKLNWLKVDPLFDDTIKRDPLIRSVTPHWTKRYHGWWVGNRYWYLSANTRARNQAGKQAGKQINTKQIELSSIITLCTSFMQPTKEPTNHHKIEFRRNTEIGSQDRSNIKRNNRFKSHHTLIACRVRKWARAFTRPCLFQFVSC